MQVASIIYLVSTNFLESTNFLASTKHFDKPLLNQFVIHFISYRNYLDKRITYMDNKFSQNQSFYTPDELRNVIQLLWSQNILWTRFLIISIISKLNDIEVVTNRLFENPRDFANVFKIYYGDIIADEFENLLREHLSLTIALINSYITSNSSAIQELEKQWYENANQLALFLSNINPYWDKQMLQNVLYYHLDLTKDEILKRLNGQYAADVYLYDFIETHTHMIADIMANGIINQFYQ